MRNFFYYYQNSYTGGQNDSDEPDQLKDNECVLIQNGICDSTGYLEKRAGSAYVGDSADTAGKIVGLADFIPDSGSMKELRMKGTDLQYNNAGTWTTLDSGFTTNLDTWFTQANNKIYISNGTENTHSYDGSTVSDLGSSYPKGKYSAWWKNYFFIGGDAYIGATGYKNRVFFSNLGTPDTMTTASDYFDVGKSDGQAITGIWPLGEFLVIFKRKSIHILSGANPDQWKLSASVNNLVTIANGVGCVSAKSIVQVGNDLWFMSDDGVRSINRNEQGSVPLMGVVSSKINGTIDSINTSAYSKICGTFFDNKVYMAIPTGTSQVNNKVMVANTRITLENATNPHPWYTYTNWSPYCFLTHMNGDVAELHFGDSNKINVWQGETGTSDVEGTIDFDVRGKIIDGQSPEMRKTFRFMKYGAKGSGAYYLDVYTSTDNLSFTYRDHIYLQQGSLWGTGVWGTSIWSTPNEVKDKIAFKIASNQLQIRFRNNANGEPIVIYPFTLAVKKKKIK